MTTPIAPGDLVLWNGRAEEVTSVQHLQLLPDLISTKVWQGPHTMVTRIGAVSDGWRAHTGGERPEGVEDDDQIEVVTSSGGGSRGFPTTGKRADWDVIVAYRVVSRAERPDAVVYDPAVHGDAHADDSPEALERADRILRQQVKHHNDRSADLRAVAALADEMRCWLTNGSCAVGTSYVQTWVARLDKISPPAPEPLKVGDRVRHSAWAEDGRIVHVEDEVAMVKTDNTYDIAPLHELERLP